MAQRVPDNQGSTKRRAGREMVRLRGQDLNTPDQKPLQITPSTPKREEQPPGIIFPSGPQPRRVTAAGDRLPGIQIVLAIVRPSCGELVLFIVCHCFLDLVQYVYGYRIDAC